MTAVFGLSKPVAVQLTAPCSSGKGVAAGATIQGHVSLRAACSARRAMVSGPAASRNGLDAYQAFIQASKRIVRALADQRMRALYPLLC
jgi:hypothetical protein